MDENNNLVTIDANLLQVLVTPERGKSFISVDMESNKGYVIDYERLADAILGKIVTPLMPEDGIKIMVID